jgi:CRP/FNR family transcriptional regulator
MATENDYLKFRSHPLFANLAEQKMTEAESLMRLRTVYRGEVIKFGYGEFSKIYLLINGKIKIAQFGNDGAELIKDIITAPDVFGNINMEMHSSNDVYAQALTSNVLIAMFTIADFQYLLQSNQAMLTTFSKMVMGKLGRLEQRHSDLAFCDTKSRLIHFIKNWAQTDGNKMGDRIILNNYLTHADIANSIAASRQTVSTLLNELRDAGMLMYNRKQIELSLSLLWN